jgi:RNA polymerase primary sigma factor
MKSTDIQAWLHQQRAATYAVLLPNYTPDKWHECDVFGVTRAGYFHEFEIKLTRADFRMITAAEEMKLVRRAKRGDQAATAALLEAHRGMIYRMARRAARGDIDKLDDAVQEAQIAAIRCLKKFDPKRGYRFLTFACRKMNWALNRWRERDHLIALPSHQNLGRDDASPELRVRAEAARIIVGFAEPIDGAKLTVGHNIPDKSLAHVAETVEHRDQLQSLRDAINDLPARERMIMLRRCNGETLQEIADDFGFTREWARQQELRAFGMLRKILMPKARVKKVSSLMRARLGPNPMGSMR